MNVEVQEKDIHIPVRFSKTEFRCSSRSVLKELKGTVLSPTYKNPFVICNPYYFPVELNRASFFAYSWAEMTRTDKTHFMVLRTMHVGTETRYSH